MARGKHKSRATNRRASVTSAIIDQLKSELEMEHAALAQAESSLKQVTRLRSNLNVENAELLKEVTPYANQLRQERDFLRHVFADASVHRSRIKSTWHRYMSAAFDVAPGATHLERVESVFRTTGIQGFLDDESHLKVKNRTAESITRLQRSRGERRNVAETSTPEQSRTASLMALLDHGATGPAIFRPSRRQLLFDHDVIYLGANGQHSIRTTGLTEHQQAIKTQAIASAQRLWKSHASDLDADGVHAWGSGCLIVTDGVPGDPRKALGFTPEMQELKTPQVDAFQSSIGMPLPSIPAAAREAVARRSGEDVLDTWRDVFKSRCRVTERLGLASHPFAPLAHHPQPSQGIAAQNTYALAAFSGWIHQGIGSTYARAAVGLTAAAAYWLPAGQTASFAESEPMDEVDRAEMILPFPQVFLSFAEPLVLEPSATTSPQTEKTWGALSEIAHDVYRGNSPMGRIAEERGGLAGGDTWVPPTIDDLVSEVGAHVEGVLLLADSLGRPEDNFAWCLAIPGAYGSTLGRFVIPALRSATEYRTVIDNLTAVVAWAQWHEPDQSTTVPLGLSDDDLENHIASADFQRNAQRAGAGIRVVDGGSTHRSTAPHSTSNGETSGVYVAPHIRRGHWRRQRFGQGRELTKRIRIAPVLVNAHRGDIAPRVYLLRSNT